MHMTRAEACPYLLGLGLEEPWRTSVVSQHPLGSPCTDAAVVHGPQPTAHGSRRIERAETGRGSFPMPLPGSFFSSSLTIFTTKLRWLLPSLVVSQFLSCEDPLETSSRASEQKKQFDSSCARDGRVRGREGGGRPLFKLPPAC